MTSEKMIKLAEVLDSVGYEINSFNVNKESAFTAELIELTISRTYAKKEPEKTGDNT